MTRDGWRVLIKGLSVFVGAMAFLAGLFWVVVAQVLEGYQSGAGAAWAFAALFTLVGIGLCTWPWLLWKPTEPKP
ncbi:hypothetical protein ACETK8_09360 [Brevundimonas staleyi]|uniref:DUF2842 domain-containing protein n=1 Tax=Brevundimonas staleyi TaxID=74326 RepID=A0ABW0FNW2_9CAUL